MQAVIEQALDGVSGDLAGIGILLAGLAVSLGMGAKVVWTVFTWLDKKLEDQANFDDLKRAFREDGWARWWRRLVVVGLNWLDRWFGSPGSFQAFSMCLGLALVYPALAILIGWVIGGPLWKFESIEPTTVVDRLYTILVFSFASSGYFGISVLFMKYRSSIIVKVVYCLGNLGVSQFTSRFLSVVLNFVGFVIFLAIGIFLILFVILLFKESTNLTDSISLFVLIGVFVFYSPVNPWWVLIAIITGGVVVLMVAGAVGVVIRSDFIVLYGLFPIINAFFDWLSWAISRYLIRSLFSRAASTLPRWWSIVWHVAVDLGLALIFLGALATSMAGALGLANRLGADFPWREFLSAAYSPFGKGISVTIMLTSTLVPTALHLAAALAALVVPSFARPWVAQNTDATAPIARTGLVVSTLVSAAFSVMLFVVIVVVLVNLVSAVFPHLGGGLAEWTLTVGSWAEGAPAR